MYYISLMISGLSKGGMNKLKYFENVFKISLLIFLFLLGVMIGQETEAKSNRIYSDVITDLELQEKRFIGKREDGLEIYFDGIKDGKVVLIVCNNTGTKLQEVSIMNMTINGEKIESFSCLDGIKNGEIKKCSLPFNTNDLSENTVGQIAGELYVRGSSYYYYQKLNLDFGS